MNVFRLALVAATIAFSAEMARADDLQDGLTAAQAGDADAQYHLGWMYFVGDGVIQDSAEAARWYRLAADQGHATAQHNLGMMYVTGFFGILDGAEAARWYRLAADQGNAFAQYHLGVMYRDGTGVPGDFVTAHMWLNIAAENGDEYAADLRDDLEQQMTPEDISEATRRAKLCMASSYADCD